VYADLRTCDCYEVSLAVCSKATFLLSERDFTDMLRTATSQVVEIPRLSVDIILAGDRCILVAKKATNSLVRHQTFSCR
jgi:hypothetical protein